MGNQFIGEAHHRVGVQIDISRSVSCMLCVCVFSYDCALLFIAIRDRPQPAHLMQLMCRICLLVLACLCLTVIRPDCCSVGLFFRAACRPSGMGVHFCWGFSAFTCIHLCAHALQPALVVMACGLIAGLGELRRLHSAPPRDAGLALQSHEFGRRCLVGALASDAERRSSAGMWPKGRVRLFRAMGSCGVGVSSWNPATHNRMPRGRLGCTTDRLPGACGRSQLPFGRQLSKICFGSAQSSRVWSNRPASVNTSPNLVELAKLWSKPSHICSRSGPELAEEAQFSSNSPEAWSKPPMCRSDSTPTQGFVPSGSGARPS